MQPSDCVNPVVLLASHVHMAREAMPTFLGPDRSQVFLLEPENGYLTNTAGASWRSAICRGGHWGSPFFKTSILGVERAV